MRILIVIWAIVLWFTVVGVNAQDIYHTRERIEVSKGTTVCWCEEGWRKMPDLDKIKIHSTIEQEINLTFKTIRERNQFLNDFFPIRKKKCWYKDKESKEITCGEANKKDPTKMNGDYFIPNHPMGYSQIIVSWREITMRLNIDEASRRSNRLYFGEQIKPPVME